ncbi:hypothetical protein SODALDRAFT_225059 [Sodiomyces alkalinus F11]|uniref:Uncharacterized protein n=1 Tax=Sodiomyces alkalinus (strain CBS 110278 / VKM F-3762 / F11) TaxID=1314773 RepID=A0A3N2PQ73_SODAK|nr:hypothetical protein SODALDRAFT_225059 [Sodiomyces alkalinus F11]ROT36659.1 hypothetical protein SODALDRAFT_225059 [Sodiomyces alkalinus F11]
MAPLIIATSIPRRARLPILLVAALAALYILSARHVPLFAVDFSRFSPFNPSRSNRMDVLRFVDPLIGTANGGHVFPGATLPYGLLGLLLLSCPKKHTYDDALSKAEKLMRIWPWI